MSLREKLAQKITKDILAKEKDFDFPSFLKTLRMHLGISQSYASRQAKLRAYVLVRFESAKIFQVPLDIEIKLLSEYYGIPADILFRKRDEYVSKLPCSS